jgi:uncharacterized membrane protein YdjX (TVP38/TMEM64 family)
LVLLASVLLASVLVVLTVGVLVLQTGDDGLVSKSDIETFIRSWGVAGAGASVLLMIVHAFTPFPAELVAVANGMLFGALWGTALTWVGAMLGAALSFGLCRRYGQPLVEGIVDPDRWQATQAWLQRRGVLALLGSRLLPVVSFNLINMAAGFAGIGWWTFLWTTALGILPMTLGMVLLGAGIIRSSPWTISLTLAAIVLVGIAAALWKRQHPLRPKGPAPDNIRTGR